MSRTIQPLLHPNLPPTLLLSDSGPFHLRSPHQPSSQARALHHRPRPTTASYPPHVRAPATPPQGRYLECASHHPITAAGNWVLQPFPDVLCTRYASGMRHVDAGMRLARVGRRIWVPEGGPLRAGRVGGEWVFKGQGARTLMVGFC